MGGINFKEGIIYYYLFQKKLTNYLIVNYKGDDNIVEGYLINPSWMEDWRNIINYNLIKSRLDTSNIYDGNFDILNNYFINYIEKDIAEEESIKIFLSKNFRTNEFDITQNKIFDESIIKNIIPKDIYKALKINDKNTKIPIKCVFKKFLLIFDIEEQQTLKIIITNTQPYYNNEKVINLSWKFLNTDLYKDYLYFLEKNNCEKIIEFFTSLEIFGYRSVRKTNPKTNKLDYHLINENLDQDTQYMTQYNDSSLIIKNPKEINFELAKRPSFRGLDNVGATCYMNATLQCLANIKPLTDYLLNKYSIIFENQPLCRLTIQYCQVLLGLFCDNSTTGSYTPQQFKNVIGEMNPLFEGVQANDSKDLIIFLLEVLNSELCKLHNKIYNITNKNNEISKLRFIDTTNEDSVLNEFLNEYKYTHCSKIGDNLCGFQKNVFCCKNCGGISNNFNLFNLIIFSLEATANLFNLNNNYNSIPLLTFDHCFKFLSKEEVFQETYCQHCKKTGNSIYKENLYVLPNYLIIILNRGKGNIFNCKVDIPLLFDSSNYEEKFKNKKYELIGIVSHFGESGMGGHFIAFCKHSMDNKWRCYNDSTVTESQNDFLDKGVPYILFYKNTEVQTKTNYNQNSNTFNNPNEIYDKFDLNNNNNNINKMNYTNQQQNNTQNIFQSMNMNYLANNFQQGYNMGMMGNMGNNYQYNINANVSNGYQGQNVNFNNNFYQNNMNNMNMFNMGNMNSNNY